MPRTRTTLMSVLIGSLLGLLTAAWLLSQLWQDYSAGARRQLAEAWMSGQRLLIDHELQRLAQLGSSLASHPGLRSQADGLERLARQHQLVALRWLSPSELALDDNPALPINYGVLDLLRRSLQGGQPPEAYEVGGRWLLYSTALIADEAGQPRGVLLLGSELSQLLARLPALPEASGTLRLVQNWNEAGPQVLLQRGNAQGEAMSWPTHHPDWQLQLVPGVGMQPPVPPLLQPVLAALAVLLGSLLGGVLAVLLQRRNLDEPMPQPVRGSRPPPPPAQPLPPVRDRGSKTGTDDVFDLSEGD